MPFDPETAISHSARIRVIGIGGGGTNAVNTMIKSKVEGVDFVAANTDIQSLMKSHAENKIQIGKELTKGLGAGADPDIGRDAALEDRHEISEYLTDSDMVFITAGMGGGTGTGGASVIAQIAKEHGALTVGVVTKPFEFEGKRRQRHAEIGIEHFKENVDTLIVIPNQKLLSIATPDLTMLDAFHLADNVLVNAVRGISDIINVPGTWNTDFADVRAIMSNMGQALMGIGEASGPNRATDAAREAISSPLLEEIDIEGATGILINISASQNLSLTEFNEACAIVKQAAHDSANIIVGAAIDEELQDSIRVTVIATGFPGQDRTSEEATKPLSSYAWGKEQEYNRPADNRMPEEPTRNGFQTGTSQRHAPPIQQNNISAPQMTGATYEPSQPPKTFSDTANKEAQELAKLTFSGLKEGPDVDVSIRSGTSQEPTLGFEPEKQRQETTKVSQQKVNSISPEELGIEIDQKIDEALKMAEKVRDLSNSEDQLDVPSFLRNGNRDLSLD